MAELAVEPGIPIALAEAFSDGSYDELARSTVNMCGFSTSLSSTVFFAIDITMNARKYLPAEEHLSTSFAVEAFKLGPSRSDHLHYARYVDFAQAIIAQVHTIEHSEPGLEVPLSVQFKSGGSDSWIAYLTAATDYVHRLLELEARATQQDIATVIGQYRAVHLNQLAKDD